MIPSDWKFESGEDTESQRKSWKQWQSMQAPSHYEKSEIFRYYISLRRNFRPPRNSCINGKDSTCYVYCFGDFAALITETKEENPDINAMVDYFDLLLDIYDVCKGSLRKLRGDPYCINMMREVSRKKTMVPFINYDAEFCMYPYHMIHAHTVAQYSLSALIMRLASHWFCKNLGDCSRCICPQICNSAMFLSNFGKPKITRGQGKYRVCDSCEKICITSESGICKDCEILLL